MNLMDWSKIMVPVVLVGMVIFCSVSANEEDIPFRDRPNLSFHAIYSDFHPKLTKVFDPLFLNISENPIYEHYLTHMKIPMNARPRFIHLKIVSPKFNNVSSDDVSIATVELEISLTCLPTYVYY